MTAALTSIDEVTPEWLTARLRQNGHLQQGRVVEIQVTNAQHKAISSFFHLRIRYATPDNLAPRQLFFKLPNPTTIWADKEHEFYTAVAPVMAAAAPGLPLSFPLCYDSVFALANGRSHLLLEDLDETHYTGDAPMPPTPQLCEAVIDAYATFHAFWWEHPLLGAGVGELLTDAMIDGFIATAREKYRQLCETVGAAHLTPAAQAALAQVCAAWPARRRKRLTAGVGVTLVHRDPHPRNFLYPRDASRHGVKLIDWQSWRVDAGADDLAYLMACHWPLAEDATVERELVKRHHGRLVELGVRQYTWEGCWYDYRASIIRCLFFLLMAWSPRPRESDVWWSRVQRGLAAYRRWGCSTIA